MKFDLFSKPRQAYSRGVVEFTQPLQEEMDMNHNMRLDYLQLQTCPFFVYRGGSSLDNEEITISPGKGIPLDEITDLRPITFPSNANILMAEEDRLWKYAEWLTNVSPVAAGSMPETVGPLRSTSGVVTLLRQMELQFKPVVDRFATQWKELEMSILADLDYRVDPMTKIRVLGPSIKEDSMSSDDIEEINQNLLMTTQFDVRMDVASAIHSDEIKRNEASVVLQTVTNPSLLQQTGVFGPKAFFKAAEDFFTSFGLDPEQYIDKPEVITKALTLHQEIQVCAQGEVPPMSMQDDHEAKANGLQAITQDPSYAEAKASGVYPPDMDEWLQRTVQKHMALAQALAPKGLPNPTGEQGADLNEMMSGSAPQQGGQTQATTAREAAQAEQPQQIEQGE